MEENQLIVAEEYPPVPQRFNDPTRDERLEIVRQRMLHKKSTDDLVDLWGVSIRTVKKYEHQIRANQAKYFADSFEEFVNSELDFAFTQRSECYEQWIERHSDRFQFLVIKWTERIAAIRGIDSPTKNLNLNMDFNDFAKQSGVSRRDVLLGLVRETIELLKDVPVTADELAPLREALDKVEVVTEGQ